MRRALVLLGLIAAVAAAPSVANGAAADSCGDEVDSFIRSLRELDSRLDIGLNYQQYSNRLGDISVRYDDAVDVVTAGEVSARCVYVGIRGEKAFNLYIKAQRIWSRCINDLDCSNAEIEPRLQKIWAKASKRVAQAWRNIR